jgi:energy-coupling factor transporter ATP-binding protein EcfA2
MADRVSALVLEGVTYHYPATRTPALADITLTVDRGEVAGVIGNTGAGASTLLLVAGDLVPRVLGGELTGRVTRAGRSALLLPTPWTQASGMAFTVRDEVAFGPANLGWPLERITAAVERSLARVDATHLEARDPATLSGGELQRVILAGILAMQPEILLLDEPTAELDPAGAVAVWGLLRELAAEGTAILVATSDLDALPDAADRILWLAGGRVRAVGSTRDVLSDAALWSEAGPGSTAVAGAWRRAALDAPPPLTVADAVERVR